MKCKYYEMQVWLDEHGMQHIGLFVYTQEFCILVFLQES
jgi:hypothetical protein